MSGASGLSAEYDEDGDSWCAGSVGVRAWRLRGDKLRGFCGEQERDLRGEPPRRRVILGWVGSVLGMCVPWAVESSAVSSFCVELNGGKGSKEDAGAEAGPGISPSAKLLAKASLRLSGEGWTCRTVERVLTAVPDRSGEAGAVRGRI